MRRSGHAMSGESAVTAGDLLTLDELRTLRETSTVPAP
jgi:hypothetical protein